MAESLKITTWNINSIKARLPRVLAWIESNKPDVLCLQEIKCVDDQFPIMEFESLGYHSIVKGQKSYNGVAILTRDKKPTLRHDVLPKGNGDEQARYLEIDFDGCIIAGMYCPNGNPVDTEKFDYKLAWMERLHGHVNETLLYEGKPVILCGDYNVIPEERDCFDPRAWANDALFRDETRRAFRALKNLGFVDAYDSLHPDHNNAYTFWDYQAGRWFRDEGIRIDHFLLNGIAADKATACIIDREERGKEKASDHVPVTLTLSQLSGQ